MKLYNYIDIYFLLRENLYMYVRGGNDIRHGSIRFTLMMNLNECSEAPATCWFKVVKALFATFVSFSSALIFASKSLFSF